MESESDKPPLVVVMGETASGKSALALELAEFFDGEVICADSWTVRREADIGTAKPTPADQARIPHHLLDVVAPCADFTAAVFQKMAKQAIEDISRRGKLPIMAGGTGLYIDSVIYDFSFLPEAQKEMRKELELLTVEELLDRIKQAGYDITDIDTRNKRRLMRVIETRGARPSKRDLRPNTLIIGLQRPREELRARIQARLEEQIRSGLEQEVRKLAQTYGWQCETLKGIGYNEWQDYFAGTRSLMETKIKIMKSTVDLAKRQRTWFKRNKSIQWVDNRDDAREIVTRFLNKTII